MDQNSRIFLMDGQRKVFPAEKEWNPVHILRCIRNIYSFSTITSNSKFLRYGLIEKSLLPFPKLYVVPRHWGLWVWRLIQSGLIHASELALKHPLSLIVKTLRFLQFSTISIPQLWNRNLIWGQKISIFPKWKGSHLLSRVLQLP